MQANIWALFLLCSLCSQGKLPYPGRITGTAACIQKNKTANFFNLSQSLMLFVSYMAGQRGLILPKIPITLPITPSTSLCLSVEVLVLAFHTDAPFITLQWRGATALHSRPQTCKNYYSCHHLQGIRSPTQSRCNLGAFSRMGREYSLVPYLLENQQCSWQHLT
jgi:hypothetical protein